MGTFTVTTGNDPVVKARVEAKEHIFAAKGAMMMLTSELDIEGEGTNALGDVMAKFGAGGELLEKVRIQSRTEAGEAILAPALPGEATVVTLGESKEGYLAAAWSYVGSSRYVDVKPEEVKAKAGLFGGETKLDFVRLTGYGEAVLAGLGSIITEKVAYGHPVRVDAEHLVGFSTGLEYEVKSLGSEKGKAGKTAKLVSDVTGEGLVFTFMGEGEVIMTSRNRSALIRVLGQHLKVLEAKK